MALRRDLHGLFGDPGDLGNYRITFTWSAPKAMAKKEAEKAAEEAAIREAAMFGMAWGGLDEGEVNIFQHDD